MCERAVSLILSSVGTGTRVNVFIFAVVWTCVCVTMCTGGVLFYIPLPVSVAGL